MAKNVRMQMTADEKMAYDLIGQNSINFNMAEGKIEDMLKRDKSNKFNEQVDKYTEELQAHVNKLQTAVEQVGVNMELLEIKPLFNKILIKPFEQNPFQKIVIDSKTNIVTDMGGMAPEHFNTNTGKQEKDEQQIIVGAVQEIGPDVKYLVPGDVIMYYKGSAMPVPFYKQGLWCMNETQVITVVNEGLEERFKSLKDGRN